MKIKKLHLVAISVIASLQAVSVTAKSQDGENTQNATNERVLWEDRKLEIDGISIQLATRAAYIAWDAELNAVYKKIRSLLSPENQNKLKDWQMAWIKNKDRMAQNATSPDEKEKILTEFTKDRLQDLQELLTIVEEDPERELDFEDQNARSHYLNANGLNELLLRNFPKESLRLTLGITLPPGVYYTGRQVRGMWPELRYLDLDSNQKLMLCTFSEPDEASSVEGFSTWHNGYYLSPDGACAIIEAMDEEAFRTDGAQGQTCYYIYELPALSDVPRGLPIGASPREIILKPIKTLTKAELAEGYPNASAPSKE